MPRIENPSAGGLSTLDRDVMKKRLQKNIEIPEEKE